MNRAEMNRFIADYLQNDKTTFAMMLSGEWGTGKSFYIKGSLENYVKNWKQQLIDKGKGNSRWEQLKNKHQIKKYDCIIVSLYGLSSISEISQRIYFEMRTILKNKSEKLTSAQAAGKIIGKTLLNAFSSKIGFDIETDAGSFDKIYESIDLTGKLLVFEDVERTKIDLEDFFGYVNNLCEQDGVKVLLIADEEKVREKLENYDKIKDKVVGDTIHFEPDLEATLRNIFDIYGFNDVCDLDADMSDIRKIITDRPNFRKVIYACQKVHEIFNHEYFKEYKNDDKYKDFRKCIFLSTLNFIHKFSLSYSNYPNNKKLFSELGTQKYPLPKFVHEYIFNQHLDETLIKECNEDYNFLLNTEASPDKIPEEKILLNCYYQEEVNVKSALNKISIVVSNPLKTINLITLAQLLIPLSFIICDVANDNKFKNLKDAAKKLETNILERFNRVDISTRQKIFNLAHSDESLSDNSLGYYKKIYEEITELKYINQQANKYIKCNGDFNKFFKSDNFNDSDVREFAHKADIEEFTIFLTQTKPLILSNIKGFLETHLVYLIKCNEKWSVLANKLENSIDNIDDAFICHRIKSMIPEIKARIATQTKEQ